MAGAKLRDIAAETAVLAAIYNGGGDAFVDVADIIIDPAAFTLDTHQAIYRVFEHCLQDQPNAKLDTASVFSAVNALGLKNLLENSEDRGILRSVMNFHVERANVRKLAARVRRLQVARDYKECLLQGAKELDGITGDESFDLIRAKAEGAVDAFTSRLTDTSGSAPIRLGAGIRGYVDHLIANPVTQVGIPTKYRYFDRIIGGGLRRKTVNVIGARPKIGKTQCGCNMAFNIAESGVPVLYCDTEMSKEDHWNRLIARLARVSLNELETGEFAKDPEKLRKVKEAVKIIEGVPLHFRSIAGQPFEETVSMMRRWVAKEVGIDDHGRAKDCVIVFDYLKLMSSDVLEDMAEWQALGFMMTGLHNFAVKYDLPILAFVQLNRDGIDRESTDVVSQSDRIIWLCSNFSILKLKTEDEIGEERGWGVKKPGNRKFVNLIARHGPGGEDGDYCSMNLEGKYATLEAGPSKKEMQNGNDGKTFEVNNGNSSPIPFD